MKKVFFLKTLFMLMLSSCLGQSIKNSDTKIPPIKKIEFQYVLNKEKQVYTLEDKVSIDKFVSLINDETLNHKDSLAFMGNRKVQFAVDAYLYPLNSDKFYNVHFVFSTLMGVHYYLMIGNEVGTYSFKAIPGDYRNNNLVLEMLQILNLKSDYCITQ